MVAGGCRSLQKFWCGFGMIPLYGSGGSGAVVPEVLVWWF